MTLLKETLVALVALCGRDGFLLLIGAVGVPTIGAFIGLTTVLNGLTALPAYGADMRAETVAALIAEHRLLELGLVNALRAVALPFVITMVLGLVAYALWLHKEPSYPGWRRVGDRLNALYWQAAADRRLRLRCRIAGGTLVAVALALVAALGLVEGFWAGLPVVGVAGLCVTAGFVLAAMGINRNDALFHFRGETDAVNDH